VLPASAGLVLAFPVAIWWLVGDQSAVPASARPISFGPSQIQPVDGRAIFFVVEPYRAQLTELANRLRNGRIALIISAEHLLQQTITAFGPDAPACPARQSSAWPKNDNETVACHGRVPAWLAQ
jgi:hypothetical protein